jgi:hypothetical protein
LVIGLIIGGVGAILVAGAAGIVCFQASGDTAIP